MVALSKPQWVSHDAQPITSVDVHPDGTRFATSGNDHKVKLWSLRACTDPAADADGSVRLLATLSGHLGAVNCARWSPDGRLLASGSDDNIVMLWRLAAAGERGGAAAFGSGAPANVERWRCVATLRGHSGDVTGVAWSPDSARLASVSLDNTVRVWDAAASTDPVAGAASQPLVAVLQGHQAWAKGLAWDPIGRYIASQGDDRAVLLWSTRDWTQVKRVEAPFQKATEKTLFRRPGWSPDGQFLCCPHAFKRPIHIAVVLRRPVRCHHRPCAACAAPAPATRRSQPQTRTRRDQPSHLRPRLVRPSTVCVCARVPSRACRPRRATTGPRSATLSATPIPSCAPLSTLTSSAARHRPPTAAAPRRRPRPRRRTRAARSAGRTRSSPSG